MTVLVSTGGLAAEANASSDWPQWRGPTRDGVAGPGPKLADAWPEGGPKPLWKSGPVPTEDVEKGEGGEGISGSGSVTVAGGKAFLYVHLKNKGKPVVLTTKDLNNLLWKEGVPDDLGLKVEEETVKGRDKAQKVGNQWKDDSVRDAFIKEFQATLDPQAVEKHGSWMKSRIAYIWNHPGDPNFWAHWDDLILMATVRDKVFATYDELKQTLTKAGLDGRKSNEYRSARLIFTLIGLDGHLSTMGNTYTDTIICWDAVTGTELWRKDFPALSSPEAAYWGASGTPAVWDGKVYAAGSAGFYCLSVKDGSVVWQAKTSFTHSSPLVTKDGVFVMLAEGLTAFDGMTGKVLWTQPAIRDRNSSVATWANGGTDYLIADAFCVNPTNGAVVWRAPTKAWGATPLVSGDIALLLSDGTMNAVALTATNGTVLWSKSPGCANGASTPVIYQGYVYQTSVRYTGSCRCRDLKTGEIKWEAGSAWELHSTIAADGKIFGTRNIGGVYPHLMMFKATPEKFELLGLGKDIVAQGPSPSIANGRLYMRLRDCVACYDIAQHGPQVDKTVVTKDK
jgi:hypothetical protein